MNDLMYRKPFAALLMLFAVLLMLCFSCGSKKKTMTPDNEVNMEEFVEFFPEVKLPFSYSDTSLNAAGVDSLLISAEIYNQFTPDSILKFNFEDKIPKLYAIGKFNDKNGDLYLLSKGITGAKKIMLLTAYNKKREFIAGFSPMQYNKISNTSTKITIDPLLNIAKRTTKTLPNNIEISGDNVYVLNSASKKFMLVMTDSLGNATELINPIDTLAKTFKYAGDYGTGNRNIISIRDDAKPGRIQFFIHLEEKNSECSGEIKGEATIVEANIAEYRKPGDPCILRFTFENNKVTLTEVDGCGSRMGALDCTFNGTYPKKKAAKK